MDCLFCKIAKGDISSYTIYEDDIVKAFLDINPVSNGHILIMPKEHYLNNNDIDLDVLKHINIVSRDLYKLLKEKLNCTGFTLVNNGESAQLVKHYHMHLVPRIENDGLEFTHQKDPLISVEEIFNKLSEK